MPYVESYYSATANQQFDLPKLEGEQQADICIIGAGFTGLSAALHLAEMGYAVSVLEAEKVGWGASGRNGGQVAPGHNMDHDELIKKVGKPMADSLWDMSIESVDLVKELIAKHQIQCDLKAGILHVAAKARHEKHIKEIEQNALKSLTFAEEQLQGNSFLIGDSYTLADVIWTVVLSRLDLLGYSEWLDEKTFPQLTNYYSRMQNRRSYTLAQVQNEWWDK